MSLQSVSLLNLTLSKIPPPPLHNHNDAMIRYRSNFTLSQSFYVVPHKF
jgi:hypothetical protein